MTERAVFRRSLRLGRIDLLPGMTDNDRRLTARRIVIRGEMPRIRQRRRSADEHSFRRQRAPSRDAVLRPTAARVRPAVVHIQAAIRFWLWPGVRLSILPAVRLVLRLLELSIRGLRVLGLFLLELSVLR